jgi:uncharacterized phage protein gp47/JayE
MAGLQPYVRGQLRQIGVEAYNAEAATPANTDANSSLGSLFDAFEMCLLLIQQEAIYENLICRLATVPPNADGSPNPDVDSFVEAFGLTRLGATPSTGQLTITLPSPVPSGPPVVQPLGALAATPDGRQFIAIVDTSGGTPYDPSLGGWPIEPGQQSVVVLVQCVAPGSIGNVAAGTITQNAGGFIGGPSISNASAYSNGTDVETDAELKARFTQQMRTGETATSSAYAAAILSVDPGLTYSIGDRLNASGTTTSAYFTVVVEYLGATSASGSGLTSAVTQALEGAPAYPGVTPVRGQGIQYTVIEPAFVPVNVAATLTIAPGYVTANVVAAASAAVTAYLGSIGLDPAGAPTSANYLRIGGILWGVPGVSGVESLLLNGTAADVTAAFAHMLCAGTMTL